jgi:hypothetical protein
VESLSVLLVESVDELHDGYQGEEFDLCKSPVKVVLAEMAELKLCHFLEIIRWWLVPGCLGLLVLSWFVCLGFFWFGLFGRGFLGLDPEPGQLWNVQVPGGVLAGWCEPIIYCYCVTVEFQFYDGLLTW